LQGLCTDNQWNHTVQSGDNWGIISWPASLLPGPYMREKPGDASSTRSCPQNIGIGSAFRVSGPNKLVFMFQYFYSFYGPAFSISGLF
jgi:hypothetical protein